MIVCLPRFKVVQHDRNPIGLTLGTLFVLVGMWPHSLCCDTALSYFMSRNFCLCYGCPSSEFETFFLCNDSAKYLFHTMTYI